MVSLEMIQQAEAQFPNLKITGIFKQPVQNYLDGSEAQIKIAAIQEEIQRLEDDVTKLEQQLAEHHKQTDEDKETIQKIKVKQEMKRATPDDEKLLKKLLEPPIFKENEIREKIKYKQLAIKELSQEPEMIRQEFYSNLAKIKIADLEAQATKAVSSLEKNLKEMEKLYSIHQFFEHSQVKEIFGNPYVSQIDFNPMEFFSDLLYFHSKMKTFIDKFIQTHKD